MLTSPSESFADDVRGLFGPDKGRGVCIPVGEVAFDMTDEGAHRVEGPAAHRFAGEDAEPGFHHVELRGTRGAEVKVHARE